MDYMLYSCPSLQYIDISSFNSSLDEVDLSDFKAEKGVLKVNKMFLDKLKVKPSENWTILLED